MGHLDVTVRIPDEQLKSGDFFKNLWDKRTQKSNVFKGRDGYRLGGIYMYHYPVKPGTIVIDGSHRDSGNVTRGYAQTGLMGSTQAANPYQELMVDWAHVADIDFEKIERVSREAAKSFYQKFDALRKNLPFPWSGTSAYEKSITRNRAFHLGLSGELDRDPIGDPDDGEYWDASEIGEKDFLEQYTPCFNIIATSAALDADWNWQEKPILSDPPKEVEWYRTFNERFIDVAGPEDTFAIFDVHV